MFCRSCSCLICGMMSCRSRRTLVFNDVEFVALVQFAQGRGDGDLAFAIETQYNSSYVILLLQDTTAPQPAFAHGAATSSRSSSRSCTGFSMERGPVVMSHDDEGMTGTRVRGVPSEASLRTGDEHLVSHSRRGRDHDDHLSTPPSLLDGSTARPEAPGGASGSIVLAAQARAVKALCRTSREWWC